MPLSPSPAYQQLSHENDVIAATPELELELELEPLSSIMHTELATFAYSCNDADFNHFLNTFIQVQESECCDGSLSALHDHDVYALALSTPTPPPSCSAEATTTPPTNYTNNKFTTHQNDLLLKSKITTNTKKRKQQQQEGSEHSSTTSKEEGIVDTNINISLTMRRVSPREGSWSHVAVVSPSTRKADGNDDETAPTPEKENKTVAATLTFDENIGIGSDENMFFDFDEDEAIAHEKLCSTNTTTTTKWDDDWQQKFSELQVRLHKMESRYLRLKEAGFVFCDVLHEAHTNRDTAAAILPQFVQPEVATVAQPAVEPMVTEEQQAAPEYDGDSEDVSAPRRRRKKKPSRCRKCGKEYAVGEWRDYHTMPSTNRDSNLLYQRGDDNRIWMYCTVPREQYEEDFPVPDGQPMPRRKRNK